MTLRWGRLIRPLLPRPLFEMLIGTDWYLNRYFTRYLREFSLDDEPELQVVRRLVARGDTVVDAGANVGVYTRFLSEWVGPTGRVYSFEPVPRTRATLITVARRLGWKNVIVLPFALSDHDGFAVMEVPRDAAGKANYYLSRIVASNRAGDGPVVAVETRRLDTVLPADCRPSFIKIDVEGHELAVVRGAAQLWDRCRPSWLVEVTTSPDDPSSDGWRLCRLFDQHGQPPFCLEEDRLRPRRPGGTAVNHFFLTPHQYEPLSRG